MASIREAMNTMLGLEFNNPKNALHWNKGESGWTYMGVYQKAHPEWAGWRIVEEVLGGTKSTEEASMVLYKDEVLTKMVGNVYKAGYWDKMKLDTIMSQKVAEEMFVFGVNAGIKPAIRLAQRIVGVKDDGLIGPMTIAALNKVDESVFDREYDLLEIAYYNNLVVKNPSFEKFIRGWHNRARAV